MASIIRVLLFLFPLVVGWLAVRFTKGAYFQPDGWAGFGLWIGQAIVVSSAAAMLATRLGNRLAPVSALFRLTLIFPDHAPSRFGLALRSGTVRQMTDGVALSSTSVQAAAEQAVAMVSALGRHERLTRGHTERVRAHAELIGQEMGLSETELQRLRWGVLLHDVGKLTVPPEILNKTERLTEEEWQCLRAHPAAGARMIAPLRPWLDDWADAAGQHHERWDGKGYPDGLAGTQISLAGRITAVADAYDVITSNRSYKTALSADAARNELARCSGAQFDPAVVRAALRIGLREPRRLGLIGWLAELPAAGRIASSAGSAGSAAVASVVAVVASVGAVQVEPPAPDALAAIAVVDVEETAALPPPSSTTLPVPSTAVPRADVVAVPTTSTTTTLAPTTTTVPPSTSSSTTVVPVTTTTAAPTTTSTTTAAPTTTTTTTTTTTVPLGGFELLAAADLPSDLENGTLESDTLIRVFAETPMTTLTADLTVRSHVDGEPIDLSNPPTTVLPSGSSICTWFVHSDVSVGTTLTGAFDFGEAILGFSLSQTDVNSTSAFERAGIDYEPTGLEVSDSLTATGTVVEVTFQLIESGRDQIRVFTAC